MLGRSSVKATNLSFFKMIGLLAVGFDLAEDTRPEGALRSDLETFAVIAARAKLESMRVASTPSACPLQPSEPVLATLRVCRSRDRIRTTC